MIRRGRRSGRAVPILLRGVQRKHPGIIVVGMSAYWAACSSAFLFTTAGRAGERRSQQSPPLPWRLSVDSKYHPGSRVGHLLLLIVLPFVTTLAFHCAFIRHRLCQEEMHEEEKQRVSAVRSPMQHQALQSGDFRQNCRQDTPAKNAEGAEKDETAAIADSGRMRGPAVVARLRRKFPIANSSSRRSGGGNDSAAGADPTSSTCVLLAAPRLKTRLASSC